MLFSNHYALHYPRVTEQSPQSVTFTSGPILKWMLFLIIGFFVLLGLFISVTMAMSGLASAKLILTISLTGLLPAFIFATAVPYSKAIRINLIDQQLEFVSRFLIKPHPAWGCATSPIEGTILLKKSSIDSGVIFIQSETVKTISFHFGRFNKDAFDQSHRLLAELISEEAVKDDYRDLRSAYALESEPQYGHGSMAQVSHAHFKSEENPSSIKMEAIAPDQPETEEMLLDQVGKQMGGWAIWLLLYSLTTIGIGVTADIPVQIVLGILMILSGIVAWRLKHPAFFILFAVIFGWMGLNRLYGALVLNGSIRLLRGGILLTIMAFLTFKAWRANMPVWQRLTEIALAENKNKYQRVPPIVVWSGVAFTGISVFAFVMNGAAGFLYGIGEAAIMRQIAALFHVIYVNFSLVGFGLSLAALVSKFQPKWIIYPSLFFSLGILILLVFNLVASTT